jgi:solute carrier family 25 carnitine/acylcarnitine transporter 20/29
MVSLYRAEGVRFFFAGTAGPILGLGFIDAAFFGVYGQVMYVRLPLSFLSLPLH